MNDFFQMPPKDVRITIGESKEGIHLTKTDQGVSYRLLPPMVRRDQPPCRLPPAPTTLPITLYDENDGQWKTFLASAGFVRKLQELNALNEDMTPVRQPFYLVLKKRTT